MCPNCILNQAGLQGGIYVAFGICLVFFVAALAAMYWAFKNGEFEDIEGSKFDMLDDGDNSALIEQARARVEKLRARAQNQ
jgi:cbb3-type cytochrome oxidase maturation protein